MARRPRATRIRTAPRGSPSCTTASSRTTPSCAPSWRREGQEFTTETDTETVAQLVDLQPAAAAWTPIEAAGAALRRLQGAYALAMIFAGHPELMIGAQHGAPLAVGFGEGEMFVGSDALALAPLTRRIAYLRDGDWAVVDAPGRAVLRRRGHAGRARGQADPADRRRDRQGQFPPFHGKGAARAPGGDRRYAAPHAQPRAPARSRCPTCGSTSPAVPRHDQRLRLGVLCRPGRRAGGSRHRPHARPMAMSPASSATATPPLPQGGLGLLVSQSGETADTLAALRYMREQGQHIALRAQRARKQHGARERRRAGDRRRPGDRGRQHQGVHRAACRARLPGARRRPGARHDHGRAGRRR